MLTPQAIDPNKVAVYIRWSTDDQGEGTTLETQLERCRHYLGSQGWSFREDLVYVDDGYSGGTLERPALTRLRRDVSEGRVGCVVVYKIDRLSRSVVDIVDLVLREWEGRCFVKSTTEEVNTLSPAGKMFFYILVSFAEYERSVIKERTMGGKVKRAEQGLNPGFRPPYGYVKGHDPGTVAMVETEASVVRRIFDLYLKGNGPYQIAHLLNAESTRRRGALWNPLTIRRMLSNPAYAGVLEYGRSARSPRDRSGGPKQAGTVRFDPPRFARVEGGFPALVDPGTWEEVQRLLRQRRALREGEGSRATYTDYLLSGLARCRCGAPIAGKRAGGYPYYLCSRRKRHGRSACDAGHIPAEPVHEAIARLVRSRVTTGPVAIEELAQAIDARIREVEAERHRESDGLRAIEERRRRIESDYRAGELPARLYAQEQEALDRDAQAARCRLVILEGRLARLVEIAQDQPALAMAFAQTEIWGELNGSERKRLLQKLATSIQLYRPTRSPEPPALTIEWIDLGEDVRRLEAQAYR